MILGYIDKNALYKTEDEQKSVISAYAANSGVDIDRYINLDQLDGLLKKVSVGDSVVFADVSVLGNRLEDVLNSAVLISQYRLRVYIVKGDISLDMVFPQNCGTVFSVALKLYKEILSLKNNKIQTDLLKAGKKRGRPLGSGSKKSLLDGRDDEILELLKSNLTKTQIADRLGCSKSALYFYIKQKKLAS